MMDKSKHKRGDQSLIGQLFVKRLSFCSPHSLEECALMLTSRSQSVGCGTYLGFTRPSVISVESLDADHSAFTMTQWRNGAPYLRIRGTLTRADYETMIHASSSVTRINAFLFLMILVGYMAFILLLTRESPYLIPLPLAILSIWLVIILRDRNKFCDRLVSILGSNSNG